MHINIAEYRTSSETSEKDFTICTVNFTASQNDPGAVAAGVIVALLVVVIMAAVVAMVVVFLMKKKDLTLKCKLQFQFIVFGALFAFAAELLCQSVLEKPYS